MSQKVIEIKRGDEVPDGAVYLRTERRRILLREIEFSNPTDNEKVYGFENVDVFLVPQKEKDEE